MTSEPLNQYTEICRDAIKSSSAKQYTGLTHCQARHKNQLDFSYNASFASQNVAKVMMKENGVLYSMASFKEFMASTYIAKIIFDKCQSKPNQIHHLDLSSIL